MDMAVRLPLMGKRARKISKVPKSEKSPTGLPYLTAWRVYRDLSQEELAAKIGVSQGRISQWETGDDKITWAMIKKLAVALDTTPEALVASAPGEDSLYSAVIQLPKADHPRAIRIIKSLRDPKE